MTAGLGTGKPQLAPEVVQPQQTPVQQATIITRREGGREGGRGRERERANLFTHLCTQSSTQELQALQLNQESH